MPPRPLARRMTRLQRTNFPRQLRRFRCLACWASALCWADSSRAASNATTLPIVEIEKAIRKDGLFCLRFVLETGNEKLETAFWLLLRHAVDSAQPPDEVSTVDSYDLAVRKQSCQRI